MDDLAKQAWRATLKFQIVLAVMIFVPAFSLDYWQGWLFCLVFLGSVLANTYYFLPHDPALVARRMKAGPRRSRRQAKS